LPVIGESSAEQDFGPLIQSVRESWFNQADVDALVDAGINTVRIPVSGFLRASWI
jgi:aryl-phospho-beta-D-glucosidase BglC (GH1 family)